MSIVSGPLPWIVAVAAVALLLAGVDWRSGRRVRHLARALAGASMITAIVYVGQQFFGWISYGFPNSDYWLVGAVALALSSLVLGGRVGWWRRGAALLAVPVTATAVLIAINAQYGYYPTWGSLFGVQVAHRTSLGSLIDRRQTEQTTPHVKHHHDVPDGDGAMIETPIPAPTSHFHARDAWIWVPPAYINGTERIAPVLELLAGVPGRPADWIVGGGAEAVLDHWAAGHHGVAPIVVMPDLNGSFTGDSECVDGSHGNAQSYLTVDVPAFLRAHFGVRPGASFAAAGLSEGGTCSIMLALRHRDLFRAFADYSGLTSPTPRDSVDPQYTANVFFHGSLAEYNANDPVWLLHHHRYPGLRGIIVAGQQDHDARDAQDILDPLCRNAGIQLDSLRIPGGHDFGLWHRAFTLTFPELASALAPTRLPGKPLHVR